MNSSFVSQFQGQLYFFRAKVLEPLFISDPEIYMNQSITIDLSNLNVIVSFNPNCNHNPVLKWPFKQCNELIPQVDNM